MRKTTCGAAMALAVTGSLFNVTVSNAAEVKLKLVSMLPAKTAIGKSFDGFIKRLNKEFKGEFQIDWRGGPEVVPQFKQPNAVRLGSIDMTLTSPSYANGILNVSGAANFSNKTYAEIRKTGYHDLMTKLHAAKGLVYVGGLPVSNLRFHIFLKEPIKSLADLKNMKIRVFPAIAPAIKALGALPVVLPMPAIYTSMERGLVKGFVTGASGTARQFSKVTGAYVESGFYRATFHFLANPRSWAKIPKATRDKIIAFTRDKDPAAYEASWQDELKQAYADLGKANVKAVKFSDAETAQFQKTVFDAAWDSVIKKAPKEGAQLKAMLMK